MFPTQSWRACRPVSGLCHITHNLILNWRASSQFTPIRCSSNSSNSDGSTAIDSNSYLRHPEIAQREALRQFYLTFSPQEHIEVVQGSRDLLDVPTAIHMCCHAAELKLKGQLLGTISEQDQLSYQLYGRRSRNPPGGKFWRQSKMERSCGTKNSCSRKWASKSEGI